MSWCWYGCALMLPLSRLQRSNFCWIDKVLKGPNMEKITSTVGSHLQYFSNGLDFMVTHSDHKAAIKHPESVGHIFYWWKLIVYEKNLDFSLKIKGCSCKDPLMGHGKNWGTSQDKCNFLRTISIDSQIKHCTCYIKYTEVYMYKIVFKCFENYFNSIFENVRLNWIQ